MPAPSQRRRLAVASAVVTLLAGGLAIVAIRMARGDEEHARFYETGRTINVFLADFARALEGAWAAGVGLPMASFFGDDFEGAGRGTWSLQERGAASGITLSRLLGGGPADESLDDLEGEIRAYLDGIRSLDRVQMKIDMIEEVELERRALLTVKYVLDGVDPEGALFQDRFFFRWTLENRGGKGSIEWRIVRHELVEGLRVAGDGRLFAETDPSEMGIDYRHARDPSLDPASRRLPFGIMRHGIGGVATTDYDGDGLPDLFFPDGVRSRLYRGEEPAGAERVLFEDVTAPSGLDGIDHATAAVFGDLDNDGRPDLLVSRYLAPLRVYRGTAAGVFEDVSEAMGWSEVVEPALSMTLLDYDRDGFVDVYVSVYGNALESLPRVPFFARNGRPSRLYRNEGGRRLVDVTEAAGVGATGWTMAVAAADYDGDGDPDLALANDFGRKVLYRNEGDGTFTDVAKAAGVLDFSAGMGVAFGDYDNDGRFDLYTSNLNSNQRWFGADWTISQYLRNVVRSRYLLLDASEYLALYRLLGSSWRRIGTLVGEGNSLFENLGDGSFAEHNESRTRRAGWGWSVGFLDFDNDGLLDISAANGWISGKVKDDL